MAVCLENQDCLEGGDWSLGPLTYLLQQNPSLEQRQPVLLPAPEREPQAPKFLAVATLCKSTLVAFGWSLQASWADQNAECL